MALTGTVQIEIEIQASADGFYETFKGTRTHRLPDIPRNHIHKIDVHEGDWHISGCVKQVTFAVGDTVETLKEKTEYDDENRKITFIVLEGDMMKHYKSYKATLHVNPNGEGSLVKWTLQYEKSNDDAPEPTKYKDFLVDVTKVTEAHLVSIYIEDC